MIKLEESWPKIVESKLGVNLNNFAHEAVDNFFIYSNYLQQKFNIQPNDIVIMQWTIPSRKMFIFDKDNEDHCVAIKNKSLSVTRDNKTYFRSYNDTTPSWLPVFTSKDSGINFFDTWYNNYFNSYECEVNLQAYQDAIRAKNVVHLQFNEIVDFIKTNKLYINKNDLHPDARGHIRLADLIMEKINATQDVKQGTYSG